MSLLLVHVPRRASVVGHRDAIADDAVVPHMGARQQQHVIAHARQPGHGIATARNPRLFCSIEGFLLLLARLGTMETGKLENSVPRALFQTLVGVKTMTQC